MEFDDYKSLDEIPEKEILKFLFANQIQIMRQLSLLEWHLDRKENKELELPDFQGDLSIFIKKTDSFAKRINEYLSKDDIDKGQIKF
jgi:hypothetical protein